MDKVLIVVGIVAGIFGIIYVIVMSRHRERLALIEKGVNASIFANKNPTSYITLKLGMLCVGIALGILLGTVLENHYNFTTGVAYWSMIFLLGGISLIINFLIERMLIEKDKELS
jgi:MFS family permease